MNFITLDMLLSLAGCVALVAIITEALKKYFPKINALWLNLIVSIIVGIIRIIFTSEMTPEGIITGVLNIFVIMLAAGGGYDTVKTIISKDDE